MRKLLIAGIGALLIAGTGALTVPASAATTCKDFLTGPVSGPVTVPSGITCVLEQVTETGSVIVNPGGRLFMDQSTINGSVSSDLAGADVSSFPFSIALCGDNHVTGSVTVTRAASNVLIGDPHYCGGNFIDGAVTLNSNNVGPELFLNDIEGSVTVNSNQGTTHDDSASADVGTNYIDGALNCTGNVNGVTDSTGANKAAAKTGQCAKL